MLPVEIRIVLIGRHVAAFGSLFPARGEDVGAGVEEGAEEEKIGHFNLFPWQNRVIPRVETDIE